MNSDVVGEYFHNIGWQVLGDEPPGLVGNRILVRSRESGEAYRAYLIETECDEVAHAMCKNAEDAFGLKSSDTVAPLKMGWITPTLYYQISTMSADDQPLVSLPREAYAETAQDACRTLLNLISSLEDLIRKHLCHLAVSPWTIYKNHEHTRLGELWFFRYGHYGASKKEQMTITAIPPKVWDFCAPEVLMRLIPRDHSIIAPHTGKHSDMYSTTLMVLYLFAGYKPDRSVEDSKNRAKAIREICPLFDKETAQWLALGLEPDVRERLTMYQFRFVIGRLAEQLGIKYHWR